MRRVSALLALAIGLSLLWAATAQAQVRGKEIILGLGAEPRTLLAATIVDWTTNNALDPASKSHFAAAAYCGLVREVVYAAKVTPR